MCPHWDKRLQIQLSTSASHSILTPGRPVPCWPYNARQGSHWSANFKSLILLDPEISHHKRDSNTGSSALKVDAFTLNVLYHTIPHKLCGCGINNVHGLQSFVSTHSEESGSVLFILSLQEQMLLTFAFLKQNSFTSLEEWVLVLWTVHHCHQEDKRRCNRYVVCHTILLIFMYVFCVFASVPPSPLQPLPAPLPCYLIIIIIIIAFKGAIWDFLQSSHCATNRLQHVRSSGPGAIVCKSRATHRVLITCNMSC